jgi:cell division protein ZapA (FtsZ GTPase activity inhibitor)
MEHLIPITIVIVDRTYRIRIDPKDEEVVRKTVKTINDKIIDYKTQFAGKDIQDYLAMVLVWFATEQNAGVTRQMGDDTITGKLDIFEKMLDRHLGGE